MMWPEGVDPLEGIQTWAAVSTAPTTVSAADIVRAAEALRTVVKPPTPKIINPLRLCPCEGAKAFHVILDADPGNQGVRALLADYLEERGEPWAAGLRWLVREGRHPTNDLDGGRRWDWWREGVRGALPRAVYDGSVTWAWKDALGHNGRPHVYDTRLEAEGWLCAYFEAAGVPEEFLGEG